MLPNYDALVQAGYPYGQVGQDPLGDVYTEWMRTKPDRILYVPHGEKSGTTYNVMVRMILSPCDDELIAVWTQGTVEGFGDNRVVYARSRDGVYWTKPEVLMPDVLAKHGQLSSVFPVVTSRGRIYLFFMLQTPNSDNNTSDSGVMSCVYSDDGLKTFHGEGIIPFVRHRYDNPDGVSDKNWVPQTVMRDRLGRPLVMCTYYSSHSIKPGGANWVHEDARCCMIRLDNLDEHPEPSEVKITWLPEDEEFISVPNPYYEGMCTAEEPFLVLLPDGRLFMTLRTMQGCVYYTVSDDDGHHFRTPEPLLLENGERALHPLAPCPVYNFGHGKYALLFHNNPGIRRGMDENEPVPWPEGINVASFVRNPLFISKGVYVPEAHQPIRFSMPEVLLDTQDIMLNPKKTSEVSLYGDLCQWKGRWLLWYPDRKIYLLGKDLTPYAE